MLSLLLHRRLLVDLLLLGLVDVSLALIEHFLLSLGLLLSNPFENVFRIVSRVGLLLGKRRVLLWGF